MRWRKRETVSTKSNKLVYVQKMKSTDERWILNGNASPHITYLSRRVIWFRNICFFFLFHLFLHSHFAQSTLNHFAMEKVDFVCAPVISLTLVVVVVVLHLLFFFVPCNVYLMCCCCTFSVYLDYIICWIIERAYIFCVNWNSTHQNIRTPTTTHRNGSGFACWTLRLSTLHIGTQEQTAIENEKSRAVWCENGTQERLRDVQVWKVPNV